MFFLLSHTLCDKQAEFIVEVAVVDLLFEHDLPHLAGVSSFPEVTEDHDAVDEEDEADAE